MPRPRLHDPDRVLDAVESLIVASGLAAVTIRAISAAVGVSNGALYHSFDSRAGLIGHAWVRAAHRFAAVQRASVEQAWVTEGPRAAVVAAADAPVVFAHQQPSSSAVLWTVSRGQLLESGLPDQVAEDIEGLQTSLIGLMVRLATELWDRTDALAVDTITTCIVDLPTAVVLRRGRQTNSTAREHLRATVKAVLDIGPPPAKKGTRSWESI